MGSQIHLMTVMLRKRILKNAFSSASSSFTGAGRGGPRRYVPTATMALRIVVVGGSTMAASYYYYFYDDENGHDISSATTLLEGSPAPKNPNTPPTTTTSTAAATTTTTTKTNQHNNKSHLLHYRTYRPSHWNSSNRDSSVTGSKVRRPLPTRAEQLVRLQQSTAEAPMDVLVVGGGATGCGIALDAVTRGLSTGLI